MTTLTITSTRPARRNVAVASLLDKTRQARQRVHPQRWIAKPICEPLPREQPTTHARVNVSTVAQRVGQLRMELTWVSWLVVTIVRFNAGLAEPEVATI